MSTAVPQHHDLSGYLNHQLRWVYTAWDANRHRWRGLGTDREQAEAAVVAWPDEEHQ